MPRSSVGGGRHAGRSSFARRHLPTTSTAWPVRPASSRPRGGLASHAAVVARGWGIPAVVGAERVSSSAAARCGSTGECSAPATSSRSTVAPARCSKAHVDGSTAIAPEAATLLAWAREAGVDVAATRQCPKPDARKLTSRVDADRVTPSRCHQGLCDDPGDRRRSPRDARRRPARCLTGSRRRPHRVDRRCLSS